MRNSNQVKKFYNQLVAEYDEINKLINFKNILISLVNVLTGFIFYATIIIILYIGGKQALLGNASVGDIISIFTISTELVMPVNLITSSISNIQSVNDIKKDLSINNKVKFFDNKNKLKFEKIEFRSTTCKINDNIIISNFTAEFERNKKYLIKGNSGSGKSTLALLMTKNREGNNIFLNNKSLDNYTYNEIQNMITYVPQNVFIFKGSILDNITFYENAEDKDIIKLLEETSLEDKFKTISELREMKYDKKSSNISGGQKQRIAIIRAILQDKQVIIFDETLSGLDKDTYLQVEKLLLGMKNKTIIHISHRTYPETINLYDRIYNIENDKDFKI